MESPLKKKNTPFAKNHKRVEGHSHNASYVNPTKGHNSKQGKYAILSFVIAHLPLRYASLWGRKIGQPARNKSLYTTKPKTVFRRVLPVCSRVPKDVLYPSVAVKILDKLNKKKRLQRIAGGTTTAHALRYPI